MVRKKVIKKSVYIHSIQLIGFHAININKPKMIISTYNLRYSVLRFQIFLVDENQVANAN